MSESSCGAHGRTTRILRRTIRGSRIATGSCSPSASSSMADSRRSSSRCLSRRSTTRCSEIGGAAMRFLIGWFAARDRGFTALRRAARTAIVMPALFAIGDKVIGNADVATFAAFGSFACSCWSISAGRSRARGGPDGTRTGRCRVRLRRDPGLAQRMARSRGDGPRRVRRAVRRRRQLGPRERFDRPVAGVHPPRVPRQPGLDDPGPPGWLGHGIGGLDRGDRGPGPAPRRDLLRAPVVAPQERSPRASAPRSRTRSPIAMRRPRPRSSRRSPRQTQPWPRCTAASSRPPTDRPA